jgi:hypothetical protein
LSIKDLGPGVRLRQVLGTDRAINSDTLSFDDQGYAQFAPAINGLYTKRSASFRIRPEWRLDAGWQQSPSRRWLGSLVHHGSRQELAVTYRHRLEDHRLNIGVHALAHMPGSISVGWQAPHWGIHWRGDRLKPGDARIWSLSGTLTY